MSGAKVDPFKFLSAYRETEDRLSSTVKISHSQVLILVVKDLIAKRNSPRNEVIDSFDNVLKYYLGEEDFQKFVVNGEDVF